MLYYYVTNLQGDVTGIWDSNGARVLDYAYTGYGEGVYSIYNAELAPDIAALNPLCYRG